MTTEEKILEQLKVIGLLLSFLVGLQFGKMVGDAIGLAWRIFR